MNVEKQLVVFELATEHYGVDISAVEGIIKIQEITVMPHAPAYVEGITNLRGIVLPVIDLRKRFGVAAVDTTKVSRIIVVEISGMTVGMIVDAVTEVLRVQEEVIEPPSPIVATVDSAFIAGIAKIGEQLVILLDLTKMLSAEDRAELQTRPVAA